MLWTDIAHAMGAGPQGAEGASGGAMLSNIIPFVLMFAVFYFLLIRPQQKRAKEHRAMLSALKRGDKVVTSGGLHGTVVEAREDVLVIDLGQTQVTVGRGFVAGVVGAKPQADKKAGKDKGDKEGSKDKADSAE